MLAGTGVVVGLAGCSDETDPDSQREVRNPTLGDEDGVDLLVFEDLGCPACASYSLNIFENLRRDYIETGEINYIFHDLVLPADSFSEEAHQVMRAVQDVEGEEAFWEFKMYIYENQNRLGWDLLEEAASEVSDETDEIIERAQNREYLSVIEENGDLAEEYSIPGTPGFHMEGTTFESIQSYSQLASQIDAAMRDA